ncbi:MAG: hypothetical protein ACK5AO_03955, partial [bacterium]
LTLFACRNCRVPVATLIVVCADKEVANKKRTNDKIKVIIRSSPNLHFRTKRKTGMGIILFATIKAGCTILCTL